MNKEFKTKVISIILILIFISILVISGFKIIKYFKDAKDNEKILNLISEDIQVQESVGEGTQPKYSIDFASLKEKNSDTVGFLKVNGTDVEHMVVKGIDNSYYLTHNFERNYNNAGWPFVDYRNILDGTDKNIVIYGHNMKNNTMFGTLKNILTKEWQENNENRFITFITEGKEEKYEVFSVYQIEEEAYYLTTDFSNMDFQIFIDTLKSRSTYDFNVDIANTDQILTLSTCANNNKYRIVLHAKK